MQKTDLNFKLLFNNATMKDAIKIIKKSPVLFFITLLIITCIQGASGASIRAGVAKVNITKDNPTIFVNDSLYAKALVLDDGKNKALIITVDIIYVTNQFVADIKTQIENELKINRNNIMISAAHAHWVQNQIADDYGNRILKAVKEASSKMVAVKIGAGTGFENRISMNRRLELENGKEWTIRRATPEPRDEIIKKIADPFDPEIGIIRIDKINGDPLAVLYNFASHNYTGVPNRGVTAGFTGFSSKLIEETLGNGAIALFQQGFAGDITPVLYKDVNTPKQDEMHGTLLGLSTLKAWRDITVKKETDISIITEELLLPARTDIQQQIDTLEAKREEILDYFKGQGCGALGTGTKLNFKTFIPLYIKYMMSSEYPSDYAYRYMQEEKTGINDLEMMDNDNRNDIEKYLQSIYKMEELIVTEANLSYLKNNTPQNPIKAELTGLKIGDFVLISFPGDIFSQVGLNIKKSSPYKNTFVTGYTNGNIGYAPTSDAYKGGAYEVSLSKLAPGWQKIFEEKALKIIRKL